MPSAPTTSWREETLRRAAYLYKFLEPPYGVGWSAAETELVRRARRHLHAAVKAASGRGVLRWWRDREGEAEMNLLAAETYLVSVIPLHVLRSWLPELLARTQAKLPMTDQRRLELERVAGDRVLTDYDRAVILAATERINTSALMRVARTERLRAVILLATSVLAALAAGAAILGAVVDGALPLCVTDEGARSCPAGPDRGDLDVLVVQALGVLGGGLGVVLSSRSWPGTAVPVGLIAPLALLKLVTGAWTALVGLLLIQGGFFPGVNLDSSAQTLAWAVLLGLGQQLVTRLVDRRAQQMLDQKAAAPPPAVADAEELAQQLSQQIDASVARAFEHSRRGPDLSGYTGFVRARIIEPVAGAGGAYTLGVRVQTDPPRDGAAEPVAAAGPYRDTVTFRIVPDSEYIRFAPQEQLATAVHGTSPEVLFTMSEPIDREPLIWISLYQDTQLVHLMRFPFPVAEPGHR